ncbi:hypothetical protein GCM10023339_09310 [Alloalcanivorax gelatiniphagus]
MKKDSLVPRGAPVAVAGALALSGLVALGLGPAVADTAPPPGSGLPATVSTDALPTPQISGGTGGAEGAQGGVVWATAMAGDTVFAGGNFTAATDVGATATVPRGNLLAFDVTTGELTDFAPQLNGQVLALAVSPDGETLYAGGAFTAATVPDGTDADTEPDVVQRRRLAAFDIETGALVSTFAPPVNADVAAVVATSTTVYAGGSFRGVGTADRQYLAAFGTDGTLLPWAPAATGGPVTSLTADPAGTKIAVGGFFTALNGSSNPGYGLGMVNAAGDGRTNLPMQVNEVVRNGRPTGLAPDDETDGAITALASDADNIYGTGFTYQSKEGGTLEGVFAASWDNGTTTWINDCHGDAYDVAAVGEVIYAAGHTHYCENIDGVRQGPGGVGDYPYYRAIANTKAATGSVGWEPDSGRYQNYEGLPAPTMLGWYPSFNAGTFTGQAQGPWTVTGNSDYVVFGGEFTRVDNKVQQGLVRFGVSSVVPAELELNGPQYFGTTYPIKAVSTETGTVRVSWGTNRDDDNENLTYRVQRRVTGQTQTTMVHERTVFARFWNPSTMSHSDTGLTPGASYEYRVQARDPGGLTANSPWTPVTVATAGTDSDYVEAVYADEPTHWWRLGDSAATTPAAEDRVGVQQLTTATGVTRGTAGAVGGDTDTAFTFNGAADGSAAAGDVAVTCTRTTPYEKVPVCWPPDVFTLETWFKTTTTTGGRLVGWSNRATGSSSKSDRLLYMDDAGRIRFGVRPDDRRVAISSQAGLNDGAWHHVVGTLSPEGMRLYVDGSRVASRADTTVGEHLSIGTWRLGGDSLTGWPGAPTSGYFAGSLDEVAVYKKELSSSRISTHYAEGTGGTVTKAPVAAFAVTVDQATKTVTVDGAASLPGAGGAITAYEWDFGDGTTATGVKPGAHTYPPGRYDVTLTVRDAAGRSDSLTEFVRIMGPPSGTWRISRVLARTVNVDAGLMVDPDGGAIRTYTWDWGDGTPQQSGAVSRPDHTYAADGTYTVTLTTIDDEGGSTTTSLPVTVPNAAPVALGTVTADGLTVTVDAAASSDSDGTIASYSWNFGQGLPTAQGATTQYTYAAPGTYRVRLTVVDDDGASSRLDQQVTVTASPPPTAPTPTPTPTTTPTPVTPAPPSTTKARSTLRVAKVLRSRVGGKVKVTVVWKVVRAGGGTATGEVRVKVAGRTVTKKLRKGEVRLGLGTFAPSTRLKLNGQYGGDARTLADDAVVSLKLR